MAYTFHPSSLPSILKTILFGVPVLVILIYFAQPLGDFFLPLLGAVIVIILLYLLYSFILARSYSVTLDQTSISYRYGILSKREFVISYSKVSEAGYKQSFIQRILSLGELNVDTPGGSDMVLHLKNIKYSDIKKTLDNVNT